MRKKLMLLGAPALAIACLSSLTACGKHYDLVIYNWEDYIYLGTEDNGKITDDSIVEKFVAYYAETHDGEQISVAYDRDLFFTWVTCPLESSCSCVPCILLLGTAAVG